MSTRPTGRPAKYVRRDLERRGLLELVVSICVDHGVTIDNIAAGSKQRSIAHARHHIFAAIRSIARLSFTEIGNLFGRDHTSVIHGIEAHHKRAEISPLIYRPQNGGFSRMGMGAGI